MMSKKKLNISFLLFLLSFTVFIGSCNDQPTELGYTLLYDTISLNPLNSANQKIITGAGNFLNPQQIFDVGATFIGKYKDAQSITLYRFMESNMPDSLLWLKESDIVSAYLTIYPTRYTFGDTISNLSFKVYEVVKLWSPKTPWDTFFQGGTSSPYFDYSRQLGSYNGQIPMRDTIPPFFVQIDKTLIPKWIKMQHDSTPIWGLALVPDDICNAVHQFSALALQKTTNNPTLTVEYIQNGTAQTLVMNSAWNSSISISAPPPKDEITIQGGLFYRGQLTFDLSIIPQYSTIHQAQLELTLDPSRTIWGNYKPDSLLYGGMFVYEDSSTILVDPNIVYYGYNVTGTNKYIFPRVVSFVEYWARYRTQHKFVLFPSGWNEYFRLDRLTFCGLNDPDPDKRPKLKIIYSTRPKH